MPPKCKQMQQEPPGGWKVWNANAGAAKIMREGLEDGMIEANATPKQVYESNAVFKEYKLERRGGRRRSRG
jgi:hypothetical protein